MSKIELKFPLIIRMTFILLFLILSFYILSEFKNYLRPLTLGVLFAYLLFPIANFFEKKHIPRILANIISILLGLSVIYGLGFLFIRQLGVFIDDLGEIRSQAVSNINSIFGRFELFLGIETGELKTEAVKLFQDFMESPASTVQMAFGATFNTVFTVLIMPVYVFFLLYYRNKFKTFLLMLVPANKNAVAQRIIGEINLVTIRYMTGVFIVVSILIFVNSIGFLIIGLNYAILLGTIAALLNFIPYYGTIFGYTFPFFFALFTMDSPSFAFWVAVQFVIVQFTENNILTPNIVGLHVNINPFIIILAITLGGVVWGVSGMFIAVPLITVLRVLGENIEELHPMGFLLGQSGTEEYALSTDKIKTFFRIKKKTKKTE